LYSISPNDLNCHEYLLVCPEHIKESKKVLERFDNMTSFSLHLTHHHSLSELQKKELKKIARAYLKNNRGISFAEFCIKRRYIKHRYLK